MTPKIGLIGLGIMGKPMARNLLKAGYPLTVHDLNRDAVRQIAAEGAAGEGVHGDGGRGPQPDGRHLRFRQIHQNVHALQLGDCGHRGTRRNIPRRTQPPSGK